MAFFKFRKGGDEHPTPPPAIESVEVLRKRARHRLIGAAILVLAGVVGFPLLFDNQPRPIAVDIAIEIPDKNKVKPLTVAPVEPAKATVPAIAAVTPATTPAAPAASTVAPAPIAITKAGNKEETIIESKPAAKPEPKAEPKAEAKPKNESKPTANPADKPIDKAQEAAKAQALLDGKSADGKVAPPAAAAGRFVVQVGAYADAVKAREARQKLEKAGLKTYTQVVENADGKRTRVRVGPFESKAEADKAGDKIKKLDLPVAILEL
jgi:DedD protein